MPHGNRTATCLVSAVETATHNTTQNRQKTHQKVRFQKQPPVSSEAGALCRGPAMNALPKSLTQSVPSTAHRMSWQPGNLASIYQDEVNLSVWFRGIEGPLANWLTQVASSQRFETMTRLSAEALDLSRALPDFDDMAMRQAWIDDMHFLLQLYVDLFGCEQVGVRVKCFGEPMCPHFHVDRVGVRMLCSYAGPGTQWLDNEDVDRAALKRRQPACREGRQRQALSRFDVAMLKGEGWPNNEGNGLVHRSPPEAVPRQHRILFSVEAV